MVLVVLSELHFLGNRTSKLRSRRATQAAQLQQHFMLAQARANKNKAWHEKNPLMWVGGVA